jgi:hypothetical protein
MRKEDIERILGFDRVHAIESAVRDAYIEAGLAASGDEPLAALRELLLQMLAASIVVPGDETHWHDHADRYAQRLVYVVGEAITLASKN